jgi:hypothetical protein
VQQARRFLLSRKSAIRSSVSIVSLPRAAIAFTSPPTQKVPPAPVSITALTAGFVAARRVASTSDSSIAVSSAFLRSGRLSVSVRRPSSSASMSTPLMVPSVGADRFRWSKAASARHWTTSPLFLVAFSCSFSWTRFGQYAIFAATMGGTHGLYGYSLRCR